MVDDSKAKTQESVEEPSSEQTLSESDVKETAVESTAIDSKETAKVDEKESSAEGESEESTKKEPATTKPKSDMLDKPNISEDEFITLRNEVRDLGKKKEWLFETRSLVSQQIKDLFAELKTKKEQRDVLTKKVKEFKGKREEINSEIKDSIDKIKSASGAPVERIPVGKIKKELENLQYKVETTPLSPDEEKKVMRLIKDKKKQIAKADTSSALQGESKELSQQINDTKKVSNDIHSEIQENAKASQENHEQMIAVSKDIKYLKAREKEIHYAFSELKDVYKDKRKVYTQNKRFFEKSKPKRKDHRVNEAQVMERVEANVEEKMKKGMKITTEDLMSFGR